MIFFWIGGENHPNSIRECSKLLEQFCSKWMLDQSLNRYALVDDIEPQPRRRSHTDTFSRMVDNRTDGVRGDVHAEQSVTVRASETFTARTAI